MLTADNFACAVLAVQCLAQQRAPLCRDCLCRHVEGRARSAVRLKKLIGPGDKVLFALSGGRSCTVLPGHVLYLDSAFCCCACVSGCGRICNVSAIGILIRPWRSHGAYFELFMKADCRPSCLTCLMHLLRKACSRTASPEQCSWHAWQGRTLSAHACRVCFQAADLCLNTASTSILPAHAHDLSMILRAGFVQAAAAQL